MIVVVVDKIEFVWNFVIFAKKFFHAKLIFATLLFNWIKIKIQFCVFSFFLKNAIWIKNYRYAHFSNFIAIKIYNCFNSYVIKFSKNNDVLFEKTYKYKILIVRLLKFRISIKKISTFDFKNFEKNLFYVLYIFMRTRFTIAKFTHMHNYNRTIKQFWKIIIANVEKLIILIVEIVVVKIFEYC